MDGRATPSTAPPRCSPASPPTSTDVVDVDGLEFREAFQVVGIEGGIPDKHNVVPDRCTITVNRRFAPKYTPEEAEAQVRALLEGADDVEILQAQAGGAAEPRQPAGRRLRARPLAPGAAQARVDRRRPLRVPRVPALNFGPGDPTIAHTRGEFVTRASIEQAYATLAGFVGVAQA